MARVSVALLALSAFAAAAHAAKLRHYATTDWQDPSDTPELNEYADVGTANAAHGAARQSALTGGAGLPGLSLVGGRLMHALLSTETGATWQDPGANCTGVLTVDGQVNLQAEGAYKVFYHCTAAGGEATEKRVVVVESQAMLAAAQEGGNCGVGMRPEAVDNGGGAVHTVCRFCAPGRYNAVPGSDTCKQCPAGRYQLLAGQNECHKNECPAGTYLDPKTETCATCPAHTFSTGRALGGCEPCGHNTIGEKRYNFATGGAEAGKCHTSKCVPGTYQRENGCEPCPINTYQPLFGQLRCHDCPSGMRTLTTSGARSCVPADRALTAEELQDKYLKPRTCSDITCSVSKGMHFTSTQFRHKKLDEAYNYTAIGQRIVVKHGKEGGDITGGTTVNEVHGMHHRCAVYNSDQCKCICWWNPPDHDQWQAVRSAYQEGGLHYERLQAQKDAFWDEFHKTGYLHVQGHAHGAHYRPWRTLTHYAGGNGRASNKQILLRTHREGVDYDPTAQGDWVSDRERFAT